MTGTMEPTLRDTAPSAAIAPAQSGRSGSARRWPAIVLTALAAAAMLALALPWWRQHGHGSTGYITATVDTGTVAPTVIASGTVNPVNTVQVGSYVSGVIQTLTCDFNTRVRAGQLCARVDPRPYQSLVDQAEANLGTADAQLQKDNANLAFTRLIHERDVGLLQRNIVSQETVDTATNAYAQARSQIALDQAAIRQHRAALNAARVNLGYTAIVSPVDGTVVSRNVTQGQTVAASFQTPTLFLIATDLTRMQVDNSVSESDIGRIAAGNAATFTVEAYPERTFHGSVTQVRQAPQTVQNVITYDVVVSVDNSARLLMPGMTASTRIVTQRRDGVLRVPLAALRYAPAGGADMAERGARQVRVWVLRPDGPRRVPLTTGLEDDVHAEVAQGELHAGDAVITGERRNEAGAVPPGPRLARP